MIRLLKLLFSAFLIALSGPPAYGAIDWKPVDPAELASRTPVVEKDSDAEAIFWNVWFDDSKSDKSVSTHYLRVKIFTARGVESQSRVDLTYFSGDKITEIVARTIKPDGTIIELKKEAILERTLIKRGKEKLQSKSFVMPGVEPGAIIEYRWREEISQSDTYLSLDFQREIPVREVKYYIKPYSGLSMQHRSFQMNAAPRKEKDGYTSFSLNDVPAFREEPQMPPHAEVRPWVLVYYDSEGQPANAYWHDLGKSMYEASKTELKSNDEIKRAAVAAIGDATTPEETLLKLFDFCRSKITNPFDDASGYRLEDLEKVKPNKSPAETLKRGVGTPWDIDVLFATMAIAVGFDARIVHLSDRGEVFFDPKLAIRYLLSRYDVAVKIGAGWRLFDPANRYATFGMLDWREEGVQALLPDPVNPGWITTPISPALRSVVKRSARLKLSEDGTLEGDVDLTYTGHINVEGKEFYDDLTEAEQAEEVVNEFKQLMSTAELSAVKLENVKDVDKPLRARYHVRVPQYAQRTGTRLFFQPGFFQHGGSPMFPSAARKSPIYFHYPWSEDDDVWIELPAGFELESADAPGAAKAADLATHEVLMQLAKDGGKSTLKYQRRMAFGLNGPLLFPLEAYSGLKAAFDGFHQRDGHLLTLKAAAER